MAIEKLLLIDQISEGATFPVSENGRDYQATMPVLREFMEAGFQGLVDEATAASEAAADSAADAALAASSVENLSFEFISARMAAGEAVKIAVYGNSTVDGFATTGWTANPTSGGNAIGNTNHEATAPNAYPKKLKDILRDMFGNALIDVWNAGYSGKSIIDGWALDNYDAAITNNPFYGIPDLVFVDFGLNDVRQGGSQIYEFESQLILLINKIRSYGSMPVLLTCDPVMRNFNEVNAIYNIEVTRQIDEVKRRVATKVRIPLIEKGAKLRGWANNNNDGYRWFIEQSTDVNGDGSYGSGDDVGLHFKDNGHSVKAQILASALFVNTVIFDGKNQRVTSNDARAQCFGNFLTTLSGTSGANSVQGFNFKVNYKDQNEQHKPSGPRAPMSTMWVWNESTECDLIYRGLVGEGWGTNAPDTPIADPVPPDVVVTDITTGSVLSRVPQSVGYRYSGFYKPSDVPFSVSKLKYGLNKVQYRCGDLSHYADGSNTLFFYGFFELIGDNNFAQKSRRYVDFNPADNILDVSGFNSVIGGMNDDQLVFLVDAELPIGCGISILSSSSFGGISAGIPDGYGSKQASVIYRNDATRIRAANVKFGKDTGDVISLPINVAVTIPFTGDRVLFRVEISREYGVGDAGSGSQTIRIYDGHKKDPAKLIQTTSLSSPGAIPFLFGGNVGGFYSNGALNVAGGTAIINSISSKAI